MAIKISFGECLKQLLMIRGWSASKLAREINIDPSYVRMWIRGERTPSLQSNYVNHIAESIKNGLNTSQNKPIIDSYHAFFRNMGIGVDQDKPLEQCISMVLKNAQIETLLEKSRHGKIPRSRKCGGSSPNTGRPEAGSANDGCGFDRNASVPDISGIPLYIEGGYSVLRAVLTVLRAALLKHADAPGEITATFQSELPIFYESDEAYKAWSDLILQALGTKWEVQYLFRVNRNIRRSLRLVDEIISYSGYESFMPSFFSRYGIVNPPFDILTIENTGAFIFLSAGDDGYIDSALFYKQKNIVDALRKYAMKMSRDTNLILKKLSGFFDYSEYFALKNRKHGEFFAVSLDLHICTIPPPLWEKYLLNAVEDGDTRKRYLNRISELIRVFNEDVKKYKIRHICQLEALELMAETGSYLCQRFNLKPNPEDILAHLRHTVYLLKKHANFEIALVSENQDSITLPAAAWEVWCGSNAGIIAVDMDNHSGFLWLAVTEETIAEAFEDYFLELWEQITPKLKDKEYVISWLEQKASEYEKRLLAEKEI